MLVVANANADANTDAGTNERTANTAGRRSKFERRSRFSTLSSFLFKNRTGSNRMVKGLFVLLLSSLNSSSSSALVLPKDTGSAAKAVAAAAAAETVRRNIISGATIFTVGDIAAQIVTMISQPSSSSPTSSTSWAVEEGCCSSSDAATATAVAAATRSFSSFVVATRRKLMLMKNLILKLDKNRLLTATVLGAIWSGYVVPFVYGNVESHFPGNGDIQRILTKVLVTCSILSTIGNYATMFIRRFIASALKTMTNHNTSNHHQVETTINNNANTTADSKVKNDGDDHNHNQYRRRTILRQLVVIQSIRYLMQRTMGIMVLFGSIFKSCFRSCNEDIMEVIRDDLKIWPLYDFTCYTFIEPNWRPITTSIMSSGWAMYMSIASTKVNNQKQHKEKQHGLELSKVAVEKKIIEPTLKHQDKENGHHQPSQHHEEHKIAVAIAGAANNNTTSSCTADDVSVDTVDTAATPIPSATNTNTTGATPDAITHRKKNRIPLSVPS